MLDNYVRRLALPLDAKVKVIPPGQLNGRRPSVSVIIPCYNYGRYLKQCINSVLDQWGVSVDVLVIDDASTDGSDQIVRQLGALDSRIRTICHTTNKGAIVTYNEGVEQATGDYTVLLSADDLLAPGCLARATALLEAHPSVGFAYGFPVQFTDGTLPSARTTAKSWVIWPGGDWIMQRCRAGGNALKSPEAVIRTSVFQRIGNIRADLPHAADFETWMRLAAVSDVGYIVGADQTYYRIHAHNMHSNFDMLDDFSQRLASFDSVLRESPGALKEPDLMCDTAHRTLARKALGQAIRDTQHRVLARSVLGHAISRYLRGTVGDETAGDYAAFALKAWPSAKSLPEWRAVEKLLHSSGEPPGLGPSLAANIAMRKLKSRFHEYRWKWVGM